MRLTLNSSTRLTASPRRYITPAVCLGVRPARAQHHYTGLDVEIVRGDKIAALYVFLNSMPSSSARLIVLGLFTRPVARRS